MLKVALLIITCYQFTVEVVEPIPTFTVDAQTPHAVPEVVEVENDYYIARFTASYCVPCHVYENSGKWDRLKKRFPRSVVVDVETTTTWNSEVDRIPCFWLIRRSTGRPVKKWPVGKIVEIETIEEVIQELKEPISSCSPDSKQVVPVSARSQAEIDAENHLLNTHGISVSGLSLAEMEVIHDKAHGGSEYHFPILPSYNSCPSGNCPTSNSGFFFRRRR